MPEPPPLHVPRVGPEPADQPKNYEDDQDEAQHAAQSGTAIGAVAVISASAAEEQHKVMGGNLARLMGVSPSK